MKTKTLKEPKQQFHRTNTLKLYLLSRNKNTKEPFLTQYHKVRIFSPSIWILIKIQGLFTEITLKNKGNLLSLIVSFLDHPVQHIVTYIHGYTTSDLLS